MKICISTIMISGCLLFLTACAPFESTSAAPPESAPEPQTHTDISRPEAQPDESAAHSQGSAPAAQSPGTSTGQEAGELTSPTFLTEEQLAQYQLAKQAYLGFTMSAGDFGELFPLTYSLDEAGEPILMEDGMYTYYRMGGRFEKWDDFYSEMTSIFTPEYFDELNRPVDTYNMYTDIEGYTYFSAGDRGGDISHVYDSYEPISANDEEVRFYVVGHYAEDFEDIEWTGDTLICNGPMREEKFPITMENRDGAWLFSEFAITF